MRARLTQSPRWLVLLTVVAVYICFIDRIAISIAIIPMAADNGWSPSTQGAVMAAFFIGYLTLQVPAGYLADRWGGKWVLGGGVLLWSVFTLLTPPAAYMGVGMLLACRFFMGVAEAVTWPSIYALYARWVPVRRRATAVGLMNSGIAGGSVIALVVTPLIITAASWELAFYLYGILGLVWFLVWTPTTRSAPSEEGAAREESAKDGLLQPGGDSGFPRLTFRRLLGSRPVWAIAIAHMCVNWTVFLMLSWLPTFINQGLGADFSRVGVLALLPTIAAMVSTPVAGRLFDHLVSRGWAPLAVRKGMQSVAFGSMALSLTALGYVDTVAAGIVLATFSNFLMGCSVGGFGTNHLDLAPNQSGVLMGVTNTLGALSSGVAVFVSGVVLEYTQSWVAVFQLAALVAMVGGVCYWRWASVERQFD